MSDLISRHEAIQAISNEWEEEIVAGITVGEILLYCRNALYSVPPAQQWTPVSEGLPKDDGEYLVCYEEAYREDYGLTEIGIAPIEVDYEGFGYWKEFFDRHTLGSLGSDFYRIPVTAWMPCPKPYKPDGGNKCE